jgi:hypothetical protein
MRPRQRQLYGEDHWVIEWTMVLSLAEPDGSPFTARVEMLDVVTVNPQGEVTRKDVYMNGRAPGQAFPPDLHLFAAYLEGFCDAD